jgi:hypothetical protein
LWEDGAIWFKGSGSRQAYSTTIADRPQAVQKENLLFKQVQTFEGVPNNVERHYKATNMLGLFLVEKKYTITTVCNKKCSQSRF